MDHEALRTQLLAERSTALASAQKLADDDDVIAASQRAGESRTRDVSDGDSLSVERGLVAKLSSATRAALADIDAALARMDAGTYGVCAGCGEEIPFERLEARPRVTTCLRCASASRR